MDQVLHKIQFITCRVKDAKHLMEANEMEKTYKELEKASKKIDDLYEIPFMKKWDSELPF